MLKKNNNKFTNIAKDANRASTSIGSIATKLNTAFSLAGLYQVGHAIGTVTQSAIDMTETINLFSVALGDNAVEANKNVEAMSKITGMDTTNLQQSIGTFSLLARSMGMSTFQANTLSNTSARLALDLASLTNVPVAQVMGDIKSGLVGQTETMYKYGVDITEASLKQEALAEGISKSVRQMSQGEKMGLRYNLMLKQTNLAHGDFAKTIDSPANQLKILGERIVTAGRAIGTIFVPMLTKILPVANAVVIVITRIANSIAKMFGYQADVVKNTTNALGTYADDSSEAVDGVTDSLKKLRTYQLGMDELNVINTDSADSAVGGASTGGAGDIDIQSYDSLFDTLSNKAEALADELQPTIEKILKTVALVGTALLTWKIGKFIAEVVHVIGLIGGKLLLNIGEVKAFFDLMKMDGGWKAFFSTFRTLYPVLSKILGVLSILASLTIIVANISAVLDDKYSATSLKSILLNVLAGALAGVGAVLLGASGLIGISIAIGVALVATIVSIFMDNAQDAETAYQNSDFKKGIDEIVARGEESREVTAELIVNLKTKIGKVEDNLEAEFGKMKAMVDRVFELEALKKTPEILNMMKTYINELDAMGLHELKASFDETTGTITATKDEIYKVIDAMIEQAKMTAYTDLLTESYKTQIETLMELEKTKKDQNDLDKTYQTMLDEKNRVLKLYNDQIAENTKNGVANTEATEKLFDELGLLEKQTEDARIAMELHSGALKDVQTKYNEAGQTIVDVEKKMFGLKTGVSDTTLIYEEFGRGMLNLGGQAKTAVNSINTAMTGLKTNYVIDVTIQSTRVDKDLDLNGKVTQQTVTKHAKGGFPDMGSMFIANEAGAEMIGNINGKTAVVNNDQIVDAVSSGVAKAVASVMGNQNEQSIVVTLDGDVIYKNQQKVGRERGFDFGMGVFAR